MTDSHRLTVAIAELARAVAFLDDCKRDVATAASTGAYSDALDYVESGARDVVEAAAAQALAARVRKLGGVDTREAQHLEAPGG